ncbi:MAG: hypothetical protein KIS96_05745 [Bauldia sp.]|nr:hypothetical protein [Bauldia sp.]
MMHTRFPFADGGVPRLADLAGLGDRFHFWCGASGRRYLFSAVEARALADFRDALVVLARRDANGALIGEAVTLIGSTDAAERGALTARLAADPRLEAFVHLLAPTLHARQAALDDLLGQTPRLAA